MPRVIITVPGKNPQPYRFQLDRKVVSLGRGSDNDIVIESGSVSVKHAEMHRVEGGYELADVGSTNGIKYGGERQLKLTLRSGMAVKMGDVAFDFTLSEEELEALGREKPAVEPPIMKEPELEAQPRSSGDEPRQRPPRRPPAPVAPAGASFGMVVFFLLLAAAAFYTGMEIRHRKEVGEPLIKGIVNKGDVGKAAPAEPEGKGE